MNLSEYNQLKQRVDKLRREADKAAGACEQIQTRLEQEFGCKTVKQAEKKLALLNKEIEEQEVEYNRAFTEFQSKWEELL